MKQIKQFITGTVNTILFIINLIVALIPFTPAAILKLLLPVRAIRKGCDTVMNTVCTWWIEINGLIIYLTTPVEWCIDKIETVKPEGWYLLISNHQSWVDILALQKVFNKKIPFIKFFIKKQLLAVPLLGFAWWALDFPTMRRHTKEQIQRNPVLKGKDLEETRQACEKFKTTPITVMNFVEGTRYTSEKHSRQNSPFDHLLKPKAGGISYVLSAMGEYLDKIIDVTIKYSKKNVSFWDYLSGNVEKIYVSARLIDIGPHLIGDYFNDENFRASFQEWLNTVWSEKNKMLSDQTLLDC